MEFLELIFNKCWEELLKHKDSDYTTLYFNEKEKSLTYIGDWWDYQEVEEEKAKEVLRSWINTQYNTFGWVYLYTSRDNVLISIDMDLDNMDPGEKDYMELQEGYGEIEFRIGSDYYF